MSKKYSLKHRVILSEASTWGPAGKTGDQETLDLAKDLDTKGADGLMKSFLKMGNGKDVKPAWKAMQTYIRGKDEDDQGAYGKDVGNRMLDVFKKLAKATNQADGKDIEELTARGKDYWKKGAEDPDHVAYKNLLKFFTELHDGTLAIEGVRPKLKVVPGSGGGMNLQDSNGTTIATITGDPYSPPVRGEPKKPGSTNVLKYTITTTGQGSPPISEEHFLSKTASDQAEELAAAIMGGWAVGGSGYSYDALDSAQNKWEVKMLSALGKAARLGAGGAAVGAEDITRMRTFISQIEAVKTKIEADMASPKDAYAFLADRNSRATTVVKELHGLLESILDDKYGRTTPTNIKALVSRGEITQKRMADLNTEIEKLSQLLQDCHNVLDELDIDDLVATQGKNRRYHRAAGSSLSARRASRARMQQLAGVDQDSSTEQEESAQISTQIEDAQEYLCSIEAQIVDHEYFAEDVSAKDTQVAKTMSSLSVSEPGGFAQFMRDYMDAAPYSEAEVKKKKLHGFIFVISGKDVKASGTEVYILPYQAVQEEAKKGNVFTGGYTQQTPNIGFKV